jgi:drug/metabolite transporter (DMT)-like permease
MFNSIKKREHNIVLLLLGIFTLSLAGTLIKLSHAPVYAIAFYRLFIASIFIFLMAPVSISEQMAKVRTKELLWMILGGIVFSLHFITWIYGLKTVSVFEGMVVVATNPIYTTIGAYIFFRERPRSKFIPAFILAFIGTILTFIEGVSRLKGDITGMSMIFLSTLLFSAYVLTGKKVRQTHDSNVYIVMLYFFASMVCLGFMFAFNEPLISYTPRNYLFFFLLAFVPTVIGHGSLNHCVGHFRASTISMLTLLEPVAGSVAAYAALGERIGAFSFLGFLMICSGIGLLFRAELIGIAKRLLRR